jgi:DNA-binding FadR family transcriptional regulator
MAKIARGPMATEKKVVGNLGTQVAAILGQRIVRGELAPGTTLPTEVELCELYGVSRTTVREALKRLLGKGLVAGTARAGTRVLPTGSWNQFDPDLLTWRLEAAPDSELLQELYEIRSCFEPEACRVAALHATDEDNRRIARAFEDMTRLRTQPAELIKADLEFHLAIVDATRNRFFVTLGQAVRTALWVSFSLLQHRPDLPVIELEMHGRVAAAIAGGRGDEAAGEMRALIELSQKNIEASFRERPRERTPAR